MKADGVWGLIKELKDASCDVQSLGGNILDYIYLYLSRDYFDYEMEVLASEKDNNSYSYLSSVRSLNSFKAEVYRFLDSEYSVVSYFREMVKENKEEFINLFIEKTEPYFELIKNKYYSRDDFKIVSFSFNLYTMLAAYHYCKDDFERYKAVLDDVDFLISYNNYTVGSNLLIKKKRVIDLLISSDAYVKNECLRNELKGVLKNIQSPYSFKDHYPSAYEVAVDSITRIQKDYEEVCEEYPDSLILDMNSLSSTILSSVKQNQKIDSRYHKYFLLGHRYNFINSTLSEYISSGPLTSEIINRVIDMEFVMFNNESVNEEGKIDFANNDFLIKCLESVLDSDCFEEVNRKLVALKYASELYSEGERDKALSLCEKLCTGDYKCVNKGKIIEYNLNANSMNNVARPKRIADRMIQVYKKLYPDISDKIPYILSSAYKDRASRSLSSFDETFVKCVDEHQFSYEESLREKERKDREEQERLAMLENVVEEAVEEKVEVPNDEVKDKVPQKRKSFFKGWN